MASHRVVNSVAMTSPELEEIKRFFGVVAEQLRTDIRVVAEGVSQNTEKIEIVRQELRSDIAEVKSLVKASRADLDRRVSSLETDRA
jgi:glycerol kinase